MHSVRNVQIVHNHRSARRRDRWHKLRGKPSNRSSGYTGVSQHQHEPALAPQELDRLRRPVAVEVTPQSEFVLEALE